MEFDEQLYLKYACVAYVRSKHRSEKPECGGSTPLAGTNTCFYSFWMCDKGRMSVLLASLKLT